MLRLLEFLRRQERWIFFLVVAASCSVFFISRHFVTLDGPAHLYNANLLAHLLSGDNSFQEFYQLNSTIVPNWMGHIWLILLQLFFSGEIAEKLFLSAYVFAFAYAFRYFVFSYDRKNGILAMLILPFVFSTFLYFGFYNFILSFVFLFWLLGLQKRSCYQLTPGRMILFTFLFTCIWFSHITVFVLSLLLVATAALFPVLLRGAGEASSWKGFFPYALKLSAAALPGIILTLVYKSAYGSPDAFSYLPGKEITDYFLRIHSLIHYTTDEAKFTVYFLWFYAGSILILLFFRYYTKRPSETWLRESDYFLLLSIPVAALAYLLPDSDSKGGYITLRLNFVFFLLVFCWIALQHWNSLLQMVFTGAMLVLFAKHIQFRTTIQTQAAVIAADIHRAAEFLPDQAVVLPVHFSSNWVTGHYSNYLGADKPVVILENYEAIQDYFPLRWRMNSPVPPVGGPNPEAFCGEQKAFFQGQYPAITHVFILHGDVKASSDCESIMREQLENACELKYSSQFCSLYGVASR